MTGIAPPASSPALGEYLAKLEMEKDGGPPPSADQQGASILDAIPDGQVVVAPSPRKQLPTFDTQPATRRAGWWRTALGFGGSPPKEGEKEYLIGRPYYEGAGVVQDSTRARVLFEQAARLGFAPAQCCLGCLCMWGEGGPQDFAQAQEWFRTAAKQGNIEAQYQLGLLRFDVLGGPLTH